MPRNVQRQQIHAYFFSIIIHNKYEFEAMLLKYLICAFCKQQNGYIVLEFLLVSFERAVNRIYNGNITPDSQNVCPSVETNMNGTFI